MHINMAQAIGKNIKWERKNGRERFCTLWVLWVPLSNPHRCDCDGVNIPHLWQGHNNYSSWHWLKSFQVYTGKKKTPGYTENPAALTGRSNGAFTTLG